jgi:LacI family transcriptional regulator, galactose operon repressor
MARRRDVVPGKDGRATLATVAASAGVSVATVSKVLNGRDDVAPTTRALIETLLEEHEYVARRADPGARGAAGAPSTVELVFHGPLTAYCMEVLQGVLDAGTAAGVTVAVSTRQRDERTARGRLATWAGYLASAGRQAVIAVVNELTAAELGALSRAGLPLVVIDPLNLPRARVTSVGSTNFAGGLAATQHLLSLGHRRIGYIGGPVAAACNQARMHGYRAAMEAAGARVSKAYVRHGHFRYQDGVDEGSALLDLSPAPTAIFAGNDETAAGVIEAARARGLRVPEDLSVVGFDDTHVAQLASPPLTTVRQPLREMGGVALRTAIRLAAGEKLESHHVELATSLVVRRSTAAPPGR